MTLGQIGKEVLWNILLARIAATQSGANIRGISRASRNGLCGFAGIGLVHGKRGARHAFWPLATIAGAGVP